MSRTLFSYIFRDLVKVFFLASGALAGIMSFGGLLRPFQEHGLDGSQVVSILGYLMPAMTTYSLPVAALFATTFVYGRLSSDNELTACRAAGMSYAAVIFPALVLGLTVASASLALLCFVVPAATLQVERTIFGNLAGLVATQIQRTRQLDFDAGSSPVTLYAQTATVLPTETAPGGAAGQSAAGRQQAVRLGNVMIVTYGRGRDRDAKRTPEEVFTAGTATAFFTLPAKESADGSDEEAGADPVIRISLENGAKIPRTVAGRETQALAAGVGTTLFGPFPVESLVKENPKFMDVRRLHVLLNHPEQGKRVRRVLDDFVAEDQRAAYLGRLAGELNEAGTTRFDAGGDTVQLWRGSAAAGADRSKLELNVPPVGLPTVTAGGVVQADTAAPPPIRFGQWRDGRPVVEATAQGARLRVYPTADGGQMTVVLDLVDADVRAGASGAGGTTGPPPATSPSDAGASVVRTNFEKRWVIDMPPALEQFAARTVPQYLADGTKGPRQVAALYRAATKQANSLTSEIHARLSFAVSCLILVLVGGTLGMLFRSGNFLSAFAVSVVPAIVSIVLIVTGQHVAENVPWNAAPGFDNPLALGIGLIWSGNLLVLLFGFGLVWKLGRS